MNAAKQFAQKLNGRSYGNELTQDEAQAAKDLNLVIVFKNKKTNC